jgi:hypothetical protein
MELAHVLPAMLPKGCVHRLKHGPSSYGEDHQKQVEHLQNGQSINDIPALYLEDTRPAGERSRPIFPVYHARFPLYSSIEVGYHKRHSPL